MNYEYKMDSAWTHYSAGRHDAAIDVLKSVLAEHPNDAMAHGLLAANLLQKSRIYAAEYELQIALQLNPREPFLFLLQARLHGLRSKPKLALVSCDEALAINPDYYSAHLQKSTAYMLMGKRRPALESIQSAAAIHPDGLEVTLAFGHYYFDTGDLVKAEAYAMEALKQDAQNEDANVLMGKVALAGGRLADAEYHSKFAIMNNPQSAVALLLLGDIKARQSWFLGLWWRLNAKLATMGDLKQTTWLIGAYVVFRFLALAIEDLGYPNTAAVIAYTWIALAIYTWVALPIYYRTLKKELSQFQFNRNF